MRALQSMQDVSAVAKRGVALITNLLSEERRLRQERAKDGIAVAMTGEAGGARGLKRTFTSDGASSDGQGEYTQAAKKMAFNNDIVSPAPSSAVSTPTSDQLQHPSPAYSANGASGAYFKHPGGGGTYANGTSPLLSGSDSAPFDYGVPPEFLSTFAESGEFSRWPPSKRLVLTDRFPLLFSSSKLLALPSSLYSHAQVVTGDSSTPRRLASAGSLQASTALRAAAEEGR